MEALLYFIFWAGLILVMMRFGCGAHILGHGSRQTTSAGAPSDAGQAPRWIPPEKDTDPVCGEKIHTATAKSSVFDGYVYYFCSRECREVFEASPELYIGKSEVSNNQLLGKSHA